MNFIGRMAEQFKKFHQRMRRWRRVVTAMAAVVVFITTYALILPAITLDDNSASDQEGLSLETSGNGAQAQESGGSSDADGKQSKDASQDAEEKDSDGGESSSEQAADVQNDADKDTADAADAKDTADASAAEDSTADSASGETGESEYVARTLPPVETDHYKVTVSFDKDAQLTDDITLDVKELSESSQEYKDAKKAVVEEKKSGDEDFDEDSIGLAALDISLIDADGNLVEPAKDAKVSVQIEMTDLPEYAAADSIEVQHIQDDSNKTTATTVADAGSATDGTVTVNEEKTVAEFEVESFSTFAITWTNKVSLTVHYVDTSGNEISGTQSATITVSTVSV